MQSDDDGNKGSGGGRGAGREILVWDPFEGIVTQLSLFDIYRNSTSPQLLLKQKGTALRRAT